MGTYQISDARYGELEREARMQAEMDSRWPSEEGVDLDDDDQVEGLMEQRDALVQECLEPLLQAAQADLDAAVPARDETLMALEATAMVIAERFGALHIAGNVSQYLLLERPDGERLKVRISDHAPPVGRGGYIVGGEVGLDTHAESDLSIHPGGLTADQAIQQIDRWMHECAGASPAASSPRN